MCYLRRVSTGFLIFLALFLPVLTVSASPYYLTHPSYFLSENGAYISFDSSLYPLTFITLYKDVTEKWHFNSTHIVSNVDMEILAFFQDGWFNYSSIAGEQYIKTETKPTTVYSMNATHIEIGLHDLDGTAIESNETVYWSAGWYN